MTELAQARKFYDIAVQITECVAVALDDHQGIGTLGRPNRVIGLVPGNQVAWDACGPGNCGQLATASLHGPYPSQTFPAESSEDPLRNGGCIPGSSAMRLVTSLTRCEYHPSMRRIGDKLFPPTADVLLDAAFLQEIEAAVMRDAVHCCLHNLRKNHTIPNYRVGSIDRVNNGDCGEISIVWWVGVV